MRPQTSILSNIVIFLLCLTLSTLIVKAAPVDPEDHDGPAPLTITKEVDPPRVAVNVDPPPVVVNVDLPPVAVEVDLPPVAVEVDLPPVEVEVDFPPVSVEVDFPPLVVEVDPSSVVGEPDPPAVVGEPDPPAVVGEPDPPAVVGDEPEPPAVVGEPDLPAVVGEPDLPAVVEEPDLPAVVGEGLEPPVVVGEPALPALFGEELEPPAVVGEPDLPTVDEEVFEPPAVVVEELEPSPIDQADVPISVRSGSASLTWLEEWQRRVVDLNWYVHHLQGENLALEHQVVEFEDELKNIQELEESLSAEVNTWNRGLQFPGLSPVHDPIGIVDDVLNNVGQTVTDCADAFAKDYKKPGVYLVHPVGSAYKVRALCIDGWSILQRRFDGSEDFHRKFDDYIAGFGNFSGEFFLGLENIHLLTQSEPYTLRIDVKGTTGKWYFAIYENFQLAGELDDYRLKLGNMIAGNYVDTLENSRDQKFSALDRDNDGWKGGNCAEHYRGGWWSNQCITNLNTMWCRSGCLQWGDKLIIDSLIRIRPSASLDPDDMTETLNPVGFSTDG